MVRHRHVKRGPPFSESKNGKAASRGEETGDGGMARQILWISFGLFVICIVAYLVQLGSFDPPVNAPFDASKVSSELGRNDSRFWGTYRPGVYFGLRTRAPKDLLVGLMWMSPMESLRHWCEQSDDLESFGWLQHDGENFGYQELIDKSVLLKTSFVKRGEAWTAKIRAESRHSSPQKQITSLFFYAGLEAGSSPTENLRYDKDENIIFGSTSRLGNFKISFHEKGDGIIGVYNAALETPGPHKYSEMVMRSLKLKNGIIALDRPTGDRPDLGIYQVVAKFPFELEVVFTPLNGNEEQELKGEAYDQLLSNWKEKFNDKFESTFQLKSKGFDEKAIKFAQAAMSNMIGGIGYFYGHSLVQSEKSNGPVNYWDAPLLTAVPSRSFFPRGFLWDEGFHNLLISKWNPEISMDILGHWMDLLNNEGWIPREQILGLEARAKVPDEFVVQRNRNANPPTLLLSLDSMIKDQSMKVSDSFKTYLKKMWPRLEKWFGWFHRTQIGEIPGTYRWRGRNSSAIFELNPKTLTSGLDDFPRASHPTNEERHIDLRCWMALASSLMSNIGKIIGIDSKEMELYTSTSKTLTDHVLLDQTHWSEEFGAYLDYGLHTEQVSLKRPPQKRGNMQHHHEPPPQKIRVIGKEPTFQFVNQVGYVSLFPFILKIVSPDSPKLKKILSDLENPNIFYTDYGLRSLSRSSSLYNKRNTEHDPPYWRGPIWININYLSVRALHHYAYSVPGPFSQEAKRIYSKLRSNLIKNLMKEYYRTGYIWEQYDDSTGAGQGCRPFTGWSSLIVLIMGENY